MATKTWSLDEGLGQFLNQSWASTQGPRMEEGAELWKQSNPDWATNNPMSWVKDIPGLDFSMGNWGKSKSIYDPANIQALKAYGPDKIADKMGWQYDPTSQQFTTPWEEDNFFGDFMEFAKVPLTFGGLMLGANALTGALGGAAGGASAGTGAMDMFGSMNPSGAGSVFSNTGLWGPATSAAGGGGMNFLDTLSKLFTPGGGSSPGTGIDSGMFEDAAGNLYNGGASAATASGTGLTGLFNQLTNQLPGLFPSGTGSYQFPWGTAISSLLGYMGNKSQSKDLNSLMQQIMAAQDPFASQRPQYQQQLRGLTSNPSNFFSDPAISQAIKSAMDQSNRSLVAQGYNSSGNQMAELTKVAQNEAFKQYLPFLQQIGGFAGAGFGPGNMAGAGAVGQAGAAAANQGLGNLGVGLQSVLSGQQPTLLDILKNTPEGGSILEAIKRTPQNQSLVDVFKNALG